MTHFLENETVTTPWHSWSDLQKNCAWRASVAGDLRHIFWTSEFFQTQLANLHPRLVNQSLNWHEGLWVHVGPKCSTKLSVRRLVIREKLGKIPGRCLSLPTICNLANTCLILKRTIKSQKYRTLVWRYYIL